MRFKYLLIVLLVTVFSFQQAEAAPLVGMPAVLDTHNIYSENTPNNLSPAVKGQKELVYVPNFQSASVSVIDPKTFKVIKTIKTKAGAQHVVPSWDLQTLWVNDNKGNYLTPIDPYTVSARKDIYVHDPYNLYFTPDGKSAVVMAEADRQVVFRDPQTMKIQHTTKVPCDGVNHADWSMDGNQFVVTCEFSGKILMLDTLSGKVLKVATLHSNGMHGAMPQDIKLSPDGKTFYIADMASNGIWVMPANNFGKFTFIKTGKGAHGLYVTRDSKNLLITNREEGSISVLRFTDNKLVDKWLIPGGGSPDMGNLSTDGKQFWVSGRYDSEVYVFDVQKGKFITRIKVGSEPHGLTYWPQPGRYSLGHTGIMR